MEWMDLLIVLVIAAAFFGLSRWLNKKAVEKEKRYTGMVDAEIIKVEFQPATGEPDDYDKYRGILRYQVDDKEYIKQTAQMQQKLAVGQKIHVYYDPKNPDAAVFEKGGGSFLGGLCFIVGMIFLIPIIFVIIDKLVHFVF